MVRTVVLEGEGMVGHCFGFESGEIEMKEGEETSLLKLDDLKSRLRMRRGSTVVSLSGNTFLECKFEDKFTEKL